MQKILFWALFENCDTDELTLNQLKAVNCLTRTKFIPDVSFQLLYILKSDLFTEFQEHRMASSIFALFHSVFVILLKKKKIQWIQDFFSLFFKEIYHAFLLKSESFANFFSEQTWKDRIVISK